MKKLQILRSVLAGGASVLALVHPVAAKEFDIPHGDLSEVLGAYVQQSDVQIVYVDDLVRGHRSSGAKGNYTETAALTQLLRGTGFTTMATSSNAIEIVHQKPAAPAPSNPPIRVSANIPTKASGTIETVTVTAEKVREDIQTVPIAVTALSQKQLTERQIAGGPDLIKEVPNLTFSKTNFSGYNLEIRGIGTQAISVTTDPAVAIAFNGTPFIRNHFFEQEFYDLDSVQVLRGPQGTLYGRNATAGVVNIGSAKPTDTYEAMLSADFGNYDNRRLEVMVNIPIVGDTLDLRVAGEWTKRNGYSTDTIYNKPIDGRDLWSSRVSLGWKPASNVQTYLVWEHFSEDDDRLRSGKQLCKTSQIPTSVDGVPVPTHHGFGAIENILSQGCEGTSLYSPNAFQVPNGYSLPYGTQLGIVGAAIQQNFNVYSNTTQSTNLRDIETILLPKYQAKNDTLEFNADWTISPSLTLTSETGYNHDFLNSNEDYNRFNSAPGIFTYQPGQTTHDPLAGTNGVPANAGIFCDPQLGCSDRLVLQDISTEHAWQLSQEVRLTSAFDGPLNFSVGGNLLHYETEENYYVFVNSLSLFALPQMGSANGRDNSGCLRGGFRYTDFSNSSFVAPNILNCIYVDPNPLNSVNNQGHNYFLSQNPYVLNSYAEFGELYYKLTDDVKLTTGLRFTDDQKHFGIIPSELLIPGYGYPQIGALDQKWDRLTGRGVIDWTPDLSFSDKSLFYASYSHGYKAGGANPPGAFYPTAGEDSNGGSANFNPIHPLTFKPEYIEAFELGTKNTFLDDSLMLNGDVFYYNYTGYQVSEIVDRTAINNNYNAHVEGAEFEANWEPVPGLKFSLAQGLEDSGLAGGQQGIDLMDRTAGNPNWIVVKPYVTVSSNCIFPTYVVAAMIPLDLNNAGNECSIAYSQHLDPVTFLPYVPNPTVSAVGQTVPPGYPGFDPLTAPNNGEGFNKPLAGHQVPNAPHLTTSFTAEYTMPVSKDWAATFHADFYFQSQQWARVFADPIDKIRSYSTTNLSLILNSADGWQVMGYVKNVFDATAITGTFLNSDDSGLTTNVFLTDPRLFGVRVTKHLDGDDGLWGSDYSGADLAGLFADTDKGKPTVWIELGGQLAQLENAQQNLALPFTPSFAGGASPLQVEKPARLGLEEDAAITFQPEQSDWIISGAIKFGRTGVNRHGHLQTANGVVGPIAPFTAFGHNEGGYSLYPSQNVKFADTIIANSQSHAIIDFLVGKDVGLGVFGMPGSSVLSGGVRIGEFTSKSTLNLHAEPDVQYPFPASPITDQAQKYQFEHNQQIRFHAYAQSESRQESFLGFGPQISWKASTPVTGNDDGELTFDWGANFSVLFGRQKMSEQHKTTVKSFYLTRWRNAFTFKNPKVHPGNWCNTHVSACPGFGTAPAPTAHHTNAGANARSRNVAIPNLGGFAGISVKYDNAKVSFGYRADEFLGVLDGGVASRKTYSQGFNGPYVSVSIGLGG